MWERKCIQTIAPNFMILKDIITDEMESKFEVEYF